MTIRTTWQALDHVKSLLTDGPIPWTQSYEFFSHSIIFTHIYTHTLAHWQNKIHSWGFFAKRKEKSTIQGKFLTEQIVEYRKALMLDVRVC